jgi:predicted ester cyclase
MFRVQKTARWMAWATINSGYTEHGVFSAPFRGTPPTGKSYEVVAMERFVLEKGLIIRRWGARDWTAIARQVGIPLR